MLTTGANDRGADGLPSAAAKQVGVDDITPFAIRSDARAGLRADRNHAGALAAYEAVAAGGAAGD